MTVALPLSSYWAGSQGRALGTATDPAIRLAIALGAVRSLIRVVDRTVPPLTVDWASVDEREGAPVRSASFTDFSGAEIHLNPTPLLDGTLDPGRALDVCAGFALHEASHSQESRDRYKVLVRREVMTRDDLGVEGCVAAMSRPDTIFDAATGRPTREVPAFAPMRVAAYLWNVAEDVRIEAATGARWPGFVPYFGAVLDWMWAETRRTHELPAGYGPALDDKLRIVFLACRYPDRADAAYGRTDTRDELAWWQAWQADYLADRVDTAATIQAGLDHLAEDAETKAELDKQAAAEAAERAAGEKLRAQIDRLIREGAGAYGVCVSRDGEVTPLDAATATRVDELVKEGLIEVRTVVATPGASNAPVHVRRPAETAESRRAYVGRPDATAEALRAALVFRSSAPQHDAKLLKSGVVDDEELYRWGMGDLRVFSERVIEAKPDAFLGLLVDASGSMFGRSLVTAQRLAQLFVFALHDQANVETAVWAHTADVGGESACEVFRLWSKGEPLSRLGLVTTLPHANNRDHQALEFVAGQVAQAAQPEKVVVVLSDGLPQASGLGGRPARAAVRNVVRWAAARGVRVLQVAIDSELRPEAQAEMYGPDVIPYRSDAALPRQLAQVLGRFA